MNVPGKCPVIDQERLISVSGKCPDNYQHGSVADHSNEDRSRSSLDKLIQEKDITWKKIIQISSDTDMPSNKKITELYQLRELKNILKSSYLTRKKVIKTKI